MIDLGSFLLGAIVGVVLAFMVWGLAVSERGEE